MIEEISDHDALERTMRAAIGRWPTLLPSSLPPLVLIKPNLCDIASWETGVTTDPRWIAVLARAFRSIRSDVTIRVVESDAVSAYRTYRSCDETFERLGYREASRDAGVELVNLSGVESIDLAFEGLPVPLRVPEMLLEDLYFVSIANLKVHAYERMTGVLKNSLGLLTDADISPLHPYLDRVVALLHMLCAPDLAIIDGRIGLEGKGPIIGDPVRIDRLILGTDALAVDETACRIMGVDPRGVPHLRATAGALDRRPGQYEMLGTFETRRFAFDPEGVHPTIRAKFASRRIHARLEALSSRWIDRFMRARRDPLRFAGGLLSRLRPRRHVD